jgi:hypothetical protein
VSWSYDEEPASSPLDAVRFEIQDTDPTRPLFQDEEIEYALAQEAGEEPEARGILSAAARCCEVLARRFGMQADVLVGSLQATYSKQAAQYAKLAVELRERAQGLGQPFVAAMTKSEKWELAREHNRVQPLFRREQFRIRRWGGARNGELPQGNEN